MSDVCSTCGDPVPSNNASGRISAHDKIRAGEAGWFFQWNGTTYCPLDVPAWVGPWRAKKAAEKQARNDSA